MTDLHRAAYAWAEAMAEMESANAAGAPMQIIRDQQRILGECHDELLAEAKKYFNDIYDGATE